MRRFDDDAFTEGGQIGQVDYLGQMTDQSLPFEIDLILNLSGDARVDGDAPRAAITIDPDGIDATIATIAPSVQFTVPNTLSGQGEIVADLVFHKIEDFDPDAIAKQIPALAKLMEARTQLEDLLIYMHGKSGAQQLLDKLLADQGFLTSLSKANGDGDEAPKPKRRGHKQ